MSEINGSDGPHQFRDAAAQQEENPVSQILSRASDGTIASLARDVNTANEVYTNAIKAGIEHETAIQHGVAAVNASRDVCRFQARTSQTWYQFTNEAIEQASTNMDTNAFSL